MKELKEKWRLVKRMKQGLYYISNSGKLKGVRKTSFGCKTSAGYLRGCLCHKRKYKMVFIHVLVAEAFIPNPNNKPFVNHKNGIKTDNRASNLEWCDSSENAIHAYRTGLRKAHPVSGEFNYASKLTEAKVKEIRNSNISQAKLAILYGVSRGVIQRVKERKSWKHVA